MQQVISNDHEYIFSPCVRQRVTHVYNLHISHYVMLMIYRAPCTCACLSHSFLPFLSPSLCQTHTLSFSILSFICLHFMLCLENESASGHGHAWSRQISLPRTSSLAFTKNETWFGCMSAIGSVADAPDLLHAKHSGILTLQGALRLQADSYT